jgi:hypothetical protein
MPKLDKTLKATRRAKERIDAILLRANVEDSGEARVSATFLLTIAEQFAAMVHLVEGKFSTHAPILVRSMLDELADLRNLVDDPNYLDQLKLEDARSNVLMVEDFAANPDISSDPSTRERLAEWRQKYQPICDTLKSQGLKPQRATEKFLRAKVSSLYVSFRLLSSYTHGQLTNLIARHAGDFELRYHEEPPAESTESLLTIALAILCQAANLAPKFTDVSAAEMTKAIDDIQADWTAARAGGGT